MITVYHNHNPRLEIQSDFDACDNLIKVAQVDTDDLEEAFALTNSIDHPWTENAQVRAEPGRHRSTSVGDVMEQDGDRFIVDTIGFRKWED